LIPALVAQVIGWCGAIGAGHFESCPGGVAVGVTGDREPSCGDDLEGAAAATAVPAVPTASAATAVAAIAAIAAVSAAAAVETGPADETRKWKTLVTGTSATSSTGASASFAAAATTAAATAAAGPATTTAGQGKWING
jgi:hypothetical protein